MRGWISSFLWGSVMRAVGFQDRDQRGSSQLPLHGNEIGLLQPIETAVFGVAIETKAQARDVRQGDHSGLMQTSQEPKR